MIDFEQSGRDVATALNEDLKQYSDNINKRNDKAERGFGIVETKVLGTERKLAYLYCGSRNCAGYDFVNKNVVYFPQSGHIYHANEKI